MAQSTAVTRYAETTEEVASPPVRSRWRDRLNRLALLGPAVVGVVYIGAGRTALALGVAWVIAGTPR